VVMASLRPSSPHEPLLLLGHQSSILLGHRPGLLFLPTRTRRAVLAARSSSSSVRRGEKPVEDRIREQLLNAGPPPPPSSYDTAWVAMVPAPGSPQASRFPQCVDWILRNQRGDGSWGPAPGSGDPWSLLVKDALSSTMACVLALRTWGVGDEHVGKGSSRPFLLPAIVGGVRLNRVVLMSCPGCLDTQGSASSGTTRPS
jgi:hypothetical protein